ncbi:MAG: hypothetical protein COT41_00855 [Candidatus Portnoybacteria bacterium CG08_land_8_20_14_0_20_40_83]|nr:MAG: hypothetical protein COT41_00855 [Candidatus Portnoybacteria bacterium CG08_land_8_20_14_0_20_40_83]
MRIAIFSDNFYPELSGVSDSIINLAKELVKFGHQVVFFVPKYSLKNFKKSGLPKRELDLGKSVKIYRLGSIPFSGSSSQARMVLPSLWRWLKVKKINPDIIHTQLIYGVGLEALTAAKFLKIPLVGTNHTYLREFIRYSPIHAEWFKTYALHYDAWYYNCCDYVTAPSNCVFDEMVKNGFLKPHQVISNPIDTESFLPGSERKRLEAKKEFKLTPSTIFYPGRIAAEKKIDVIVRALAIVKEKIPDVNFAIAGHGNSLSNLKILIQELGLDRNVKIFGILDKPTLVRLYQGCDIFAIASTSETQSITMLQAMACGLPVVGVNSLALPEYINSKNGLLVEAGDYKAMAEKIIYLFQNHSKMQELGQGGHKFAQNFSAENIARQWEKIYSKVIAMKK